MSQVRAVIVMATLNGAKWIRQQVESIRRQSMEDWVLLISDDGSSDATLDIILEYTEADERIELLSARTGPSGHVANFEYLLSAAQQRGCARIFLCDQDDIWEPDKLSRFLAAADSSAPNSVYYSDLQVLDEHRLEKTSFFVRMGYPQSVTTRLLLSQNTIPGCAMMLDIDLLGIALPFPEGLQNHDWWLVQCASAKGGTFFVPGSPIQYRQHDENTIGAGLSIRSLPLLPALITRQRRVLASKIVAVQRLLSHGGELDDSAESSLREWLSAFDGTSRFVAAKELVFGKFKPVSISLLTLQLIAILSQ
ncbi:MAG: glycosyltransferase family 2 protein [Halioglobus sp.]